MVGTSLGFTAILTRLRSCQALNLTYRRVNIPSPYVAFLLLFALRDTYDDADISCHGDMRVLWGLGCWQGWAAWLDGCHDPCW